MQEIAEPSAVTTENRPSTAGMTTKVVKGSLWTLFGQVAPLAVSLVATPFTIRLLGAEGYGVLILVGLIPTYLGFADLGMGLASTKFASEAYAAGDAGREARTVRTAAVIALCASVPVGLLVFLFSERIVTLFNVPEHLLWEASMALKVAAFTFVLNFLNSIFNTPQLTRLRMDLNTFVTSGFRILGIAATPIVIYLGGGILGAVAVLCVASLLTLAGHIYVSGRLLPPLFDITLDRNAIRPLLKFGGALVGAGVVGVLLVNAEKGILSVILSTTALAYYYVAFTLVNMMTMFSGAMVQSLLPAFSQLQGLERRQQLHSLYSRGIWMNVVWLIPISVFLALVAKPFFTLWAGEDFGRESTLPFYVMLFGIIFNVVAYLPHALILSSGRTDVIAKLYMLEIVPYISLVWLLTRSFGVAGAAAAWSIRAIVDAALMFGIANRIVGVEFQWRRSKPFLAACALILTPTPFALLNQEMMVFAIPLVIAASLVYIVIVWRTLLLNDELTWLSKRFYGKLRR